MDYDEMNRIFISNKIRLALGKDFFPVPEKKKYFRMAISTLNEEEITEGINRLAKAIKEIYKD